MGNDTFKYTQVDFQPQPIIVQHMDLNFDIRDDHTIVDARLHFRTRDEPLKQLSLNAMDIEMKTVESDHELAWEYDKEGDKVVITFKEPIPADTEASITTKNITRPTKNILEGLYYDETPKGAPPQQITQCQQWGFQRIVPSIDEMNAKCTYNTTITADARYTNILTNGDVTRGPEDAGDGRVKIWYDNTTTPMATYLFFLGVGTYDTFTREFEYPDGTRFDMELLAPPDTDPQVAANSLDMLFDGILWIHLYTGREAVENKALADKIYRLCYEREERKKRGEDVTELRNRLQTLASERTWGYRYTGTVYREIGMQNSNFGGMENVGNTTISTNRLLPSPDSSDGVLEYVMRVKTHEFYHNLNGSEVTGWSPFEIWLNEAVTVHMEKDYHAIIFGHAYSRLQEVQSIISPDGGVLQLDTGALARPIIPQGFNHPDELITSVTYIKSPEFVGMIERILGKEDFLKGLADYHAKFKHSNATTDDWLEALQPYTDINLKEFARPWLYETGFPVVTAKRSYADGTYTITLKHDTDFSFPFIVALCDAKGHEIASRQVFVDDKTFTIAFEDVEEPAFVSMNRDYSFFGKLIDESKTREELLLQVRNDNDIIARYFAFYWLWDEEKTRMLKDSKAEPDSELIDLTMELLQDERLMHTAGVSFLARFESVEDPRFRHDYEATYQVRKRISERIAKRHEATLKQLYQQAKASEGKGLSYNLRLAEEIKNRQTKNLCLALLSRLDTPEIHAMIREQFEQATVASERHLPARLYIESSAADRDAFIDEFAEYGTSNLRRWEAFESIIAGSDADDVIELIARVEAMPEFRIDQSNDARAVYMGFASNRRLSLLTGEGRDFLRRVIPLIATTNEYIGMHILQEFAHLDKMPHSEDRANAYKVLVDVQEDLDGKDIPIVQNNLKRLLSSLRRSKEDYEETFL